MDKFVAAAISRQTRLWNMHIPAKAKNIVVGATHTTFVHPTKGKRSIANRCLGF